MGRLNKIQGRDGFGRRKMKIGARAIRELRVVMLLHVNSPLRSAASEAFELASNSVRSRRMRCFPACSRSFGALYERELLHAAKDPR